MQYSTKQMLKEVSKMLDVAFARLDLENKAFQKLQYLSKQRKNPLMHFQLMLAGSG